MFLQHKSLHSLCQYVYFTGNDANVLFLNFLKQQQLTNISDHIEDIDMQKMSREEAWEVVEEVMKTFFTEQFLKEYPTLTDDSDDT